MSDDLGLAYYLHDDDVIQWLHGQHALLVAPGTDVPRLGSPAWHEASEPVKRAAALRAARAYYVDELFLPQRLEDELQAARYAQYVSELDAWQDAASRVVAIASAPSHEELQRRRRGAA